MMAVMLFKLRGVEDDEADEIRQLLQDHDIETYETNNGRWGLGFAAIWLHSDGSQHDVDFKQGKALIHTYQQQRQQTARADYEQRCKEGKQTTLFDVFMQRPFQVLCVLVAVLVLASLSVLPFVYV